MRVKFTRSETAKGWSKRAPKTKKQRDALFQRCGSAAFLDAKNLKYPVMAKSGPCVLDCAGIRAALSRAGQYKPSLKPKAKKLGRWSGCAWTV